MGDRQAADKAKRRLSSGNSLRRSAFIAADDSRMSDDDEQQATTTAATAVKQPTTKTAAAGPVMSNEELARMYTQVIQMCNSNKVTPKNAWGLHLIEHVDDFLTFDPTTTTTTSSTTTTGGGDGMKSGGVLSKPLLGKLNRGEASREQQQTTSATGEGMNFQKAGTTLDATALIYAARVDSVHKTTYEILGGLSHASVKPLAGDDDEDEDDDQDKQGVDEGDEFTGVSAATMIGGDGQQEEDPNNSKSGDMSTTTDGGGTAAAAAAVGSKPTEQTKQGNKKKKGSAAEGTVVTTLDKPDNLVVKSGNGGVMTPEEAAADALFRKTSEALNLGGCKGLLLNHFSAARGRQVALESKTSLEIKQDDEEEPSEVLDSSVLQGLLGSFVEIDSLALCPTIQHFTWSLSCDTSSQQRTQKNERSDNDNGTTLDINAPVPSPLPNTPPLGPAVDDEDIFAPPPPQLDDDDQPQQPMVGGDDVGGEQEEQGESHLVTDGRNTDFTFFDARAMKNWAGPGHWKFPSATANKNKQQTTAEDGADTGVKQPSTGEGEEDNNSEAEMMMAPKAKKTTSRKAKETNGGLIDFSAPLQIDRSMFDPPKGSTTLTDAALKKHTAAATTLPIDVHYDVKMLSQLFLNPSWRFTERRTPASVVNDATTTTKETTVVMDSQQTQASQSWYEANPPSFNDGGGAEIVDDDEEVPDAAGDFTDVVGCGGGSDLLAGGPQPQSSSAFAAPVLSSLVAAPAQPLSLALNYSTVVKRLEVSTIKAALWKALCRTPPITHSPSNKRSRLGAVLDDDMPFGENVLWLDVLSSLRSMVPSNVLAELSVAFCFVCLLHLCNEKGLRLHGDPSSPDLKIERVNLSQHVVQQPEDQ